MVPLHPRRCDDHAVADAPTHFTQLGRPGGGGASLPVRRTLMPPHRLAPSPSTNDRAHHAPHHQCRPMASWPRIAGRPSLAAYRWPPDGCLRLVPYSALLLTPPTPMAAWPTGLRLLDACCFSSVARPHGPGRLLGACDRPPSRLFLTPPCRLALSLGSSTVPPGAAGTRCADRSAGATHQHLPPPTRRAQLARTTCRLGAGRQKPRAQRSRRQGPSPSMRPVSE